MTPQEDRQEQLFIDMEAANERVYKALHGEEQQTAQSIGLVAPKPTRAPRKDKGSKRVKPEPPAAAMGKLTKEDASRLLDLMGTLESHTRTERDLHDTFSAATRSRKAAETELAEFIADHTA